MIFKLLSLKISSDMMSNHDKRLDCFQFLVGPDPNQNQPISGSKLVFKSWNHSLSLFLTFKAQTYCMLYAG